MLQKLHQKLLQNSLYAKWHSNPVHAVFNFIILFIFAIYVAIFMSVSVKADIADYYSATLTSQILANNSFLETQSSCSSCDELSSPPTTYIKKGGSSNVCRDNPPELPEGCIVFEGSENNNFNARWLYCWAKQSTSKPWLDICLANVGVGNACDLTEDQIESIKDMCDKKPLLEDKLECVKHIVRSVLEGNESNVCRHHARCTHKVLEKMGNNKTYTMGSFGSIGHAWNQVYTEGGNYYLDSFNLVLLWCPSPK